MKSIFCLLLVFLLLGCSETEKKQVKEIKPAKQWTTDQAWSWYDQYDWLVGTNFNPSTSVNQLEFWQEDSFDPATIRRELGWSADLGMNLHRVYLHNLLWKQDSTGFLNRLNTYLEIADSLEIKTMFVLLDDVWHPVPKLGVQPEPTPHVHNSGWVQAPGAAILGDSSRHHELKGYIIGVLQAFQDDRRVICWDLYNEPDNVANQPGRTEIELKNKHVFTYSLLKKVFHWARMVNPSQPLTTGIWKGEIKHWGNPDSLRLLERYMLMNSDVISFHAYDGDTSRVLEKISQLKKYERPLLCTEYLARSYGNTFQSILPIFKRNNIAAINWGLVSGKTNTKYPWVSWREPFSEEPEVWHHDIFRADGIPYDPEEIIFLKNIIKSESND